MILRVRLVAQTASRGHPIDGRLLSRRRPRQGNQCKIKSREKVKKSSVRSIFRTRKEKRPEALFEKAKSR